MGNEYLAVVKAAYDYAPQSEDEVAIKENQLLFLLDKSDDELRSDLHTALRP